jgi:hypothetical protein
MRTPAWPDLEFYVERDAVVASDGRRVDVRREARVAVIAETTISGRLARGLALTARGTAELSDEDAIALKRAEVTARLAELARTSAR